MIRYQYLSDLEPPAPFVNVILRNPITGEELTDVPAQIDTAADRSLLPKSIAESLSLPQIGAIPIGGIGGSTIPMPLFPVELAIQNLPARLVEVVAQDRESWVILGRDVLNGFRIILDGPRPSIEIQS